MLTMLNLYFKIYYKAMCVPITWFLSKGYWALLFLTLNYIFTNYDI